MSLRELARLTLRSLVAFTARAQSQIESNKQNKDDDYLSALILPIVRSGLKHQQEVVQIIKRCV
jgi:hypothetical protein